MSSHLGVGTLGHFAQVVLGTGSDPAKEDLLGHTAAQGHAHAVQELLPGVEVLLPRQVLSVAQPFAPWDDGHLTRGTAALSTRPLEPTNPLVSRVPRPGNPRASAGQLVQESTSSWDDLTPSDSYTVLLSLMKPIREFPGLTVGPLPSRILYRLDPPEKIPSASRHFSFQTL